MSENKVPFSQGLLDVIAGETAICTLGHQADDLQYRGYSIKDLCEYAQFEEVAYLLIYGKLPTLSELNHYIAKLQRARSIPQTLKAILKLLPSQAHPMDVLRTACSVLGILEPESLTSDLTSAREIADRVLGIFPSVLRYWMHPEEFEAFLEFNQSENMAYYLSKCLAIDSTDLILKTLNISLILYAEHEFNASTFAARVCTSTQSDFYSAITAAIGTLRGPLHGGANERAMHLIQEFATPKQAIEGVKHKLANKETIMGFGHRVYKKNDPRSDIIKRQAKLLSECSPDSSDAIIYEISQAIENTMLQEKQKYPNVDFYSASTYHFCGIQTRLFTPLFVISRVSGWAAHIIEQRSNNKLIRPAALYTGLQSQRYIPILER